jgi:uncharacterized protein DUF4184
MPFTVAHAAAALPLRRLNLVWSAFVVGSLAPDFPYVIGRVTYRSLGHDFPGVVLFTLPISFVVLWFFHRVIKKPLAGLLPIGMQQRLKDQLGEFRCGGGRRMLAIASSLILGIATHLVWDSVTHAYTWPWQHFVWPQSWFELPILGRMPAYGLLRYTSTLLGLVALAGWILLWYRNTAPDAGTPSAARLKSRVSLAVIMFLIACAAGFASVAITNTPMVLELWDWYALQFSVTALAVAFWELLLYCLVTTSLEHSHSRLSSV